MIVVTLDEQSPHRLVEFLTAVGRHEHRTPAIRAAAELAAEEFDAEIGAVVIGDELGAVFGFGTSAVPARTLCAIRSGTGTADLGAAGVSHWAAASWDIGDRGRLLVARSRDEFAPEERNLLLGMARSLGLALRMIGVLSRERERTEVLEVLLGIQRSISHRAPLSDILSAVSRGASSLLGGRPVSLVLDDELDPQHPIVAGPDLGLSVSSTTAAVHVNGVPAGALVARSDGTTLDDAERRLLAAFAEHASLALTDARTVEEMREAFHDPLTGLPNRALFLDRLTHALRLAARQDTRVSVLFIDLDRFKAVNDSIGHSAGDELLRGAAQRILSCTRAADTAARFGGDEFAVLLEATDPVIDARQVAERIIAAIRRPFRIRGKVVFVGATVGIGFADSEDRHPDELLRNADLAMYRAKRSGRGHWVAFEPGMKKALTERMQLETDVQSALGRGELSIHYQPLVELDSGTPFAVEALLRWQHPADGPIDPALFMPVAEETGAIVEIGRWVLDEACGQLARWREKLPRLNLHVNVSAPQLYGDSFQDHVAEALGAHRLPWEAITIEITESTLMADRGETGAELERLKRLGASIALDNFGTGPSSLCHLRELPVNLLKIDRSLIQTTDKAHGEAGFLQAIVVLGQAMGLDVVADGIETPEQLAQLRAIGCLLGQGSGFSPPQAAGALTDYLERAPQRLVAPKAHERSAGDDPA